MSTFLFLLSILGIILALSCVDVYADEWCKKNGY